MNSEEKVDPYVAAQIAAKTHSPVAKVKLLNMRSAYPTGLILAVEGNDDKVVFSHWIARVAPGLEYEFLVCGGKREVRRLKNALHRDLNGLSKDVKLIVDRDFDDLSGFDDISDVLALERYSIENFLAESSVIDLTLRVAFPCDGQPALRSSICAMFAEDYANFLHASRAMNRRIFVGRRLARPIDDLIPRTIDSMAAIALGSVQAIEYDPEEMIPFPDCENEDLLTQLSEEFDALDPAHRYRGKFAIKFLTKWLEQLAREFRDPKLGLFGLLGGEDRINHQEFALGLLASRSSVPTGLAAFLAA